MISNLETGNKGYLVAAMLGAVLLLSVVGLPVLGQTSSSNGQNIAYSSDIHGQVFNANASTISQGSVSVNFLGTGGNDTFNLIGGNVSGQFAATGLGNNNFNIVTGNPTMGANSSVFSLVTGDNSTFNIIQNNFNGSVTFILIGGSNSFVNATSSGPVSSTIFSIVLGLNSSAEIASTFAGNQTAINIIT